MPGWLLDTSVFYWCRSTHARERLRAQAAGARLVTAPSAPLEILAGMLKAKSFGDRQRALQSVVDLCGRDGLLGPDGDALISRAFGATREALDLDMVWEGITAAISAADPRELTEGVPDPLAQLLRKVRVNELRAWDSSVGSEFKRDMDVLYVETDPVLLSLVNAEGIIGKNADTLARLLQAICITESPKHAFSRSPGSRCARASSMR